MSAYGSGGVERGPTWWDCAELCREFVRRGYQRPVITLGANWRLDGTRGNLSWVAGVTVPRRSEKQARPFGANESFGQGGAWKTAPAAIHRALQRTLEQAAEVERAAASQAAF